MLKFFKSICAKQKSFVQPRITNQNNRPLIPILTSEVLLNTEEHRFLLHHIKKQLSVTQEDDEKWYVPLLQVIAEFMQQLPYQIIDAETETIQSHSKTLLTVSLIKTLNALKIRRGYMLPIGADTETCYQQESLWTYAVFLAALLQESWQVLAYYDIELFDHQHQSHGCWHPLITTLPKGYFYQCQIKSAHIQTKHRPAWNLWLIKSLIPDRSFQWLCENERVLEYLSTYLGGQASSHNPIATIMQQAESHMALPQSSHYPTMDQSGKTIANGFVSDSTVLENKVIQQEDATPISDTLLQQSIEEKESSPVAQIVEPQPKHHQIAELFLQWLKEAIQSSQLDKDEENPLVYRIESGILVMMPHVFDSFKKHVVEAKNLTEKHFMKALIDANLLIFNPDKKTYFHRYFKGEWQTRDSVQGLLLQPDYLLDEKEQLAISTDLQPYLF